METSENDPEINNSPEVSAEIPVISCNPDEDKVKLIHNMEEDSENTETTSPVKDHEEKTETSSSAKDSEEKTETTIFVKDSEEKTETTTYVKDSETSKSSLGNTVMKKKKTAGFQAPKKAPSMSDDGKAKPQKTKENKIKKSIDLVEQGLNDDMKKNKNEKPEKKKKPKKSRDTKEGVDESKEVKPKKIKKSAKKTSNDADKENDSKKLKQPKTASVTADDAPKVLPSDDSVQTSILSECNKNVNATKTKQEKLKKIEKKESASEPAKSLSTEEWDQLFQSAIDRVMNTPLDQLLPVHEELGHTTSTQDNGEEGAEENADTILENNSQNGRSLAVDIINGKQEIVGPEQIHEESGNNDFPLENEHIQMVECAQVQELNENTPEGSELEFNGEEDKKHQHTPVVLVKKAIKKADRNSTAKVLAPRQLQFPKPSVSENTEKQRKQHNKEIKKGKKKMMDIMERKDKRTDFAENKSNTVMVQPGRSKKELMMEREIEETGTWVQCSNTACHKWRFLQDINDPTEIDEKWICEMNNDTTYNSCEKGEQDYDESDHIYTRYSEGSIVWARMVGYPWWPAMVEIDPDTETFFELVSENSMFPSHYHVVYLDNKVSRAWVKASAMLPFHYGGEDLNKNLYLTKKSKGPNFKKEVEAAKQNALAALELPAKERLKQFSFGARFKGKWAENETKASKIKKHCRVKLTPKKSKKEVKKPKETSADNTAEHQDLTMYMLDSSTVDEMLSDQPDSILKGIEDVLDSLGSQILSDDNDEDYQPTNTECEMLTQSTESKKNASPMKKPKGTKRKNMGKDGERTVSKKSKQQKLEDVSGTTSESNKKKKVKKIKDQTVNKANKTHFSVGKLVELAENKIKDSNSDTCVKKEASSEENLASSITKTMKFDSDIFTMELDEEECENLPKQKKKKTKPVASSPPITPERKLKSNPITKPEKKKLKKSLFTVPDTASNEKSTDEYSKNSSNKSMPPKNVSSPVKENSMFKAAETTPEKHPQKNDDLPTVCDAKDVKKNLKTSPRKKPCQKKVSFSAPATVTMDSKVTVTPVNNEIHLVPCNDEQTVPDVHTQESDEEDEFLLDLPVCGQKPEIQEIQITSVSTLPAAVDTEDAYDSDPFDLMEE